LKYNVQLFQHYGKQYEHT